MEQPDRNIRRLVVIAIAAAIVVLVIGIGSALVRTGALVGMFAREAVDVLAETASPQPAAPTSSCR